jgi:hypothetical protein
VNDHDVIATTLHCRAGCVPIIHSLYMARLNNLINSLPQSCGFPNSRLWVDALVHEIDREEFSMAEDVVGFDA